MTRQMLVSALCLVTALVVIVLAAGCGDPPGPVTLGSYPLDDRTGLLAGEDVVDFDTELTTDGGGALHDYSEGKMVVNLYEIPTDAFVGDKVVARCKMRCESLAGWTTMDLWVFPVDGEPRRISQHLRTVSRTNDWHDVEIVFPLLESDIPPAKLRLAIILDGRGHLWADELEVIAMTTPEQED